MAAGSALVGGIAALLVPMAALDWLAYQLYLDQVAGVNPPLGMTAKLGFVALAALLAGAIGWLVARYFGVRSTGGLTSMLARLRGIGADDEDGAPRLRGADRHPDAPARRPLSATRDLNVEDSSIVPASVIDGYDDDEDEDELLLVSPMPTAMPVRPPAPVAEPEPIPPVPTLPLRGPARDWADWEDTDDFQVAPLRPDDLEGIPAPHADDWIDSPAGTDSAVAQSRRTARGGCPAPGRSEIRP